jgi:hypothetical protein
MANVKALDHHSPCIRRKQQAMALSSARAISTHLSLLGGLASILLRGAAEIECRIDERDVRERLGKVPELSLRARIVFFGDEGDVVYF